MTFYVVFWSLGLCPNPKPALLLITEKESDKKIATGLEEINNLRGVLSSEFDFYYRMAENQNQINLWAIKNITFIYERIEL